MRRYISFFTIQALAIVAVLAGALSAQQPIPGVGGSGGGGGASTTVTINTQTGTSYTLVAGDLGKVVNFTNAATITVTIPASLTTGFQCSILQSGAGTVSVIAAGGVTLNVLGGLISTSGQNALAVILQTAADTYVLGGSLQ